MRVPTLLLAILASCGSPAPSGTPSPGRERAHEQRAAGERAAGEPAHAQPAHAERTAGEPAHAQPAHAERTAGPAESAGEVATTSAPPSRVVLRGTQDPAGSVAIAIENRSREVVHVASALTVERRTSGGAWERGPNVAGLALRDDCEHAPPECRALAPGAALFPPPWLGTWGDAQCVCTRCGAAEPGVYRFVATTCDGAHRIEGEPFDLAAR